MRRGRSPWRRSAAISRSVVGRARALAGRPAARAVQGDARRVPGALDRAHHRITPTRRASGRSRRPRTSTRSAATGEPTPPNAAASPRPDVIPDRALAGDVHRHGPAQARPRQGAVPGRLHAEADRRPRGRDPRDRASACSTGSTGRERCDLVSDVAQPVVSRVIGSFMGIPREDDAVWARADELGARRAATQTSTRRASRA